MAAAVDRVAVGVGVAGGVEPDEGHAFAEVRAGEQAVDELFVGVGRSSIGDEGFDFGGRGRQAGEVERQAADRACGDRLRATAAVSRRRAAPATKWSISFRGQAAFGDFRAARAFTGGMNDQCLAYGAPCSIQRLSNSFCSGLSARCESGGGIISDSSCWRCGARVRSARDGRGRSARAVAVGEAESATSSRRSACRLFSSKPWHWKQFSERIGRMSRLKSSFGGAAFAKAAQAAKRASGRTILVHITSGLVGS